MVDIDEAIKNAEESIGEKLTDEQKKVINAFGQFFNMIALQSPGAKMDEDS